MSKADRFRAKQKAAGLVQANEWVPSNQRELFRAVAKALREGQAVTVGKVTSHQKPQPDVTNNRDLPPNVDELLKRKAAKRQQKTKQKVTSNHESKVASDRKKKAAQKRAQQQAEWSAIFNAEGAEQIELLTPARVSRYGVKVTSNRVKVSQYGFTSSGTETVVIVQTGKTYKRLVFTDWDSGKHTVKGGLGWQLAGPVKARQKTAQAELHRKLKEYHPDTGTHPDPLKFKETKDQLDQLRGR